MKIHFYNDAYLTTTPTEKGDKDLDVFHPSYRVKRVNRRRIIDFNPSRTADVRNIEDAQDLYIDIVQNEKNGLIKVDIEIEPIKKE